jgi:hypothetical protein
VEDRVIANLDCLLENGQDDSAGENEAIELGAPVRVEPGARALYRTSKALVLIVLATMPVLFGAVQAWVWSVYTVMIYSAFVMFVWGQGRAGTGVGLSAYGAATGLFFGWTLFACLPLPDGWMAILSPVRYRLLQQTEALTRLDAVWPTLSYAPFQSMGWWAFLLGLALLFVLLKHYFVSKQMLGWVCTILLVLAVAQGLYGILQALVPNMGVLWVNNMNSYLGNARGTWINRNHFAGFMAMMLPLMMGYCLSRVRWGAKLKFKTLLYSDRIHQHGLFLLALVVMTLALLFSQSRAGISSAFLGGGTFFFLIRGRGRKMPKRYWMIVGGFLGLTLLYGMRIGFEPIIDRFLMLDQGDTRLDFWKDSLPIISDHPLGIGLAAFKYVFPVYNVSSVSETLTPHYLHNDMLQLVVETGWPGFALLVGPFLVFMVNRFRRIQQMDYYMDPLRFFVGVGAFSGLVSISFHSLFDFNLQMPANALYFVVLLSMVAVCARGAQATKNRSL